MAREPDSDLVALLDGLTREHSRGCPSRMPGYPCTCGIGDDADAHNASLSRARALAVEQQANSREELRALEADHEALDLAFTASEQSRVMLVAERDAARAQLAHFGRLDVALGLAKMCRTGAEAVTRIVEVLDGCGVKDGAEKPPAEKADLSRYCGVCGLHPPLVADDFAACSKCGARNFVPKQCDYCGNDVSPETGACSDDHPEEE